MIQWNDLMATTPLNEETYLVNFTVNDSEFIFEAGWNKSEGGSFTITNIFFDKTIRFYKDQAYKESGMRLTDWAFINRPQKRN